MPEYTHCLITLNRARTPGAPVALLLDMQSSEIRVLRLAPELPPVSAALGVAANERHIFLVAQILRDTQPYFHTKSFCLLTLDRTNLSTLGLRSLDQYADVHSVCLNENTLYLVSSGTDEIVALKVQGAELVDAVPFWRPVPSLPRQDTHHLNSITIWNGDLIVSGFGKRTDTLWGSASNGFIYNVSRHEHLLSGINHPHSFSAVADDLIFCQSRNQAVCTLRSQQVKRLEGYTRGLCAVGGQILVGVSRARRRSKSTGMLDNWGSPGGSGGRCGLYWLDAGTLSIKHFLDLGAYGDEIYELLPISNVVDWPITSEISWRDATISGIQTAAERVRLEHEKEVLSYQSAIEALKSEMQTKIDAANHIIAELQQKLHGQSAWALETVGQVRERDGTIRELQEKLREQTDWALRTLEQVRLRDEIIQTLQAQLDRNKANKSDGPIRCSETP